jgi:hypothetical protein
MLDANVMNLTVMRNGLQVYAREQAFGGWAADSGYLRAITA